MLRITRLHLLIAAIGVICLFFGVVNWMRERPSRKAEPVQSKPVPMKPAAPVPVRSPQEMEKLKQASARSIAVIGEAYRPMRRQFGDIPPVSQPLRAAKQFQSTGDSVKAMASARDAWRALKMFRAKAASVPGTYEVIRGDTLWKIASAHSPAHAGPGWVTIWKANKRFVTNYDRLEVGWLLTIPPERAQYAMPFWKPPALPAAQ